MAAHILMPGGVTTLNQKWTWVHFYNEEYIQLLPTHKGKISFLQWSVTGSIMNHTSTWAPHPGVIGKNKKNSVIFSYIFSHNGWLEHVNVLQFFCLCIMVHGVFLLTMCMCVCMCVFLRLFLSF